VLEARGGNGIRIWVLNGKRNGKAVEFPRMEGITRELGFLFLLGSAK
jgi:hypothetical protein